VWWLATTAVALALILGFGVLEVFRLLARPLALLLFGLTLAAALAPLVSWLEHRLPRLFAIILVYFVIVIVLGGLIWAITPSLVNQAREFSDQIPELSEQAQILFNRGHQLGQIPGLVDVKATQSDDVVGQRLQRNDDRHRTEHPGRLGQPDDLVGLASIRLVPSVARAITTPPRLLRLLRFTSS
jgi:predicted PurR-regulated permease PerM